MRIRNLLLVSYDSVRADVALSRGFPTLERLRRRGVTFENCVASAPLTPISHASVMTGLQPYHHGIRHLFRESLAPGCATLAERLRPHGFRSGGVVSCPGLNRWYEIGRGFDRWDDEIPRLPDGSDPLTLVDVKLRGQALKRAPLVADRGMGLLRDPAPRRLSFIHFFDAHWPYSPPAAVPGVAVQNEYEAEIAFLDASFGQVLDELEATGAVEDTLIVLFGDHGEDLGGSYANDHAGDALGHPEENGHGCLLYDATIMVPLIFSHPSLGPRTVSEQVRLVDLAPTVLDLLGVGERHGMDGESLADVVMGRAPCRHRPAYSETLYPREMVASTGQFGWIRDKKSVRYENRFKVISHLDSDVVEAYDLREDPCERANRLAPPDVPAPAIPVAPLPGA